MAKIKVTKPTSAELEKMNVTSWGTWGCEVSVFDWTYDNTGEEQNRLSTGRKQSVLGSRGRCRRPGRSRQNPSTLRRRRS